MSFDGFRDAFTAWQERIALRLLPVVAPLAVVVGVVLIAVGRAGGWLLILGGIVAAVVWVYYRIGRRE